MPPTGEITIQIKRRDIVVSILMPLFLGFAAFMNMLDNPRFQDIRGIDVVRLMAIGACWGVSFAGLALLIRSKVRKG